MSKPKLLYFNLQGRGEQARIIFVYAGVEFEDHRVEFKDWPELKGHQPFGSLPVLQDGDFTLAQGPAIVQYLGQKYNLWPTDHKQSAYALSIVLSFEDARTLSVPVFFMKDEEEKKKKQHEVVEKLTGQWQKNLSKLLGDKKYFLCDSITAVDLAFYEGATSLSKRLGVKFDDNLQALIDRVGNEEKIKSYYEKNPITSFL